jgi:NAD(P)-dependent dehydrogenase (short-subunit alcohol dehydrogenase family)
MASVKAELDFTGRVVVVTGAGGGIGREYALMFARRGAQVVVNDLGATVAGSPDGLNRAAAVAQEITDLGGIAAWDTSSVSTAEGGEALTQTAIDRFGRVDVVVSNAGILTQMPFEDIDDDALGAMVGVHLGGAFHVVQPAWRRMKEQGYGRVILTASNSGWIGALDMAHYGAAKMALVGLTRCLALEGAPYDINVNAVAPVAVSRMQSSVRKSSSSTLMSDEERARALGPERIPPLSAWLAHESCTTTGELFSVVGSSVSRVFLGLTEGVYGDDLTPETIRDRFDEVTSTDGYVIPRQISDEVARYAERTRAAAS